LSYTRDTGLFQAARPDGQSVAAKRGQGQSQNARDHHRCERRFSQADGRWGCGALATIRAPGATKAPRRHLPPERRVQKTTRRPIRR